MKRFNILGFGWSFGCLFGLFYLACVIMMYFLDGSVTAFVFNNLLHGLDTALIIRMNAPLGEEIFGFVVIFGSGWIFGSLIAFFYNTYVEQTSKMNGE